MKKLDKLRQVAGEEIAAAADAMSQFAAKVVADPFQMTWADKAFASAASYKVWSTIRAWCDDVEDDDNRLSLITEQMRQNVMRGARYPGRSTSMSSNLLDSEITAAWSDALSRVMKW